MSRISGCIVTLGAKRAKGCEEGLRAQASRLMHREEGMGSLETPPSWVDPIVCLASIERPFDAAWPLQPGNSPVGA